MIDNIWKELNVVSTNDGKYKNIVQIKQNSLFKLPTWDGQKKLGSVQ